MDWDSIKDGGGWIIEKVYEAIWGFIYGLASNLASEAFELMTKYILIETDLSRFIEVDEYIGPLRWIAFSFLAVAVAWEGLKQQSGPSVYRTDPVSVQELIFKTMWAGVSIFMLPWMLLNTLIPLNNAFVGWISSLGISIEHGNSGPIGLLYKPAALSEMVVLCLLIFAIASIVLGIIAGIRYVELTVIYLIAPFVAVSIVRNGDALDVWIRESIAVVFTQALHIFLLHMLLNVIGKINVVGPEAYVIALGVVLVMIKGPAVLRKFVYSVGVGSAAVRGAGQAGRFAAMRMMTKSIAR